MSMTQNGKLAIDDNDKPVMGGTSSAGDGAIINAAFDPVTRRLLVDNAGGAASLVVGTTTITSGTNTRVLYDNSGILGEYTITGTGNVVMSNSPTFLDDITVGTAATASGSILFKGLTSGTVTLSVADAAGTWTMKLPTTDGDNLQFLQTDGSGNTTWASQAAATLTVGSTTISGGAATRILYDNAGTLGEYTITGTGTVVVMQTNPTLSGLTMTDATNIVFDTTTGTKIGTATTQKIGFFNAAPIVQPSAVDIVTAIQNLGLGASLTNAAAGITVGSSAITGGANTRILYDNSGVLGEYTITGSGTVVAMQTAPTFATSITTPSVLATANDSGALGAAATAFSDLFLASGALIGFANGNAVITHSSGVIGVTTGDLRVTSANVGTNADSVPTLSSTSTFTNKTITSPTINTPTLGGANQLAEGASIRLDQTLSADGTYSGITIAGTAGATLAFGDLIYLAAADSRWELTDSDSVTTAGPVWIGMCVQAAAADGDPTVILLQGNIRADAAFPSLTISAPAYVGTTAGDIQVAAPTGDNDVVRIVGHAITADSLYFNPSTDWVVLVV